MIQDVDVFCRAGRHKECYSDARWCTCPCHVHGSAWWERRCIDFGIGKSGLNFRFYEYSLFLLWRPWYTFKFEVMI